MICGSVFGEHQGKKALIRRALYGGKSAERDYWLYLRVDVWNMLVLICVKLTLIFG